MRSRWTTCRCCAKYVRALLESLDYVGVIAVEFFVTPSGLVANEMAPRVHNSGHWTIDGAVTSQFENHLRAVGSMPLGSTECKGSSVMINLVGRTPITSRILEIPNAKLHLYGKGARGTQAGTCHADWANGEVPRGCDRRTREDRCVGCLISESKQALSSLFEQFQAPHRTDQFQLLDDQIQSLPRVSCRFRMLDQAPCQLADNTH